MKIIRKLFLSACSLMFALSLCVGQTVFATPLFAKAAEGQDDVPYSTHFCYSMQELADYLNGLEPDCVKLSEDGTTLTMLSDLALVMKGQEQPNIRFVNNKTGSRKHYVLDLNGKTITSTASIMFAFYGDQYAFEITDSQGSGKIESLAPNKEGNPMIIIPSSDLGPNPDFTLLLHEVSLISQNTLLANWGPAKVEIDGADLFCGSDFSISNYGAISLTGESILNFIDGDLLAEKTIGFTIHGKAQVNFQGGSAKCLVPFSMQNDADQDASLHINGGEMEASLEAAILANAGSLQISGDPIISGPSAILASGLVEDDSFTDGVPGSGVTISITGGTLIGTQDTALSYLLSAQYQGVQDGKVLIEGGSFISSENIPSISLKNLSSIQNPKALIIESCTCSSKIDPAAIGNLNDLQVQPVIQVLDNADPDTPWHYMTSLDQALQMTSETPFNTYTYQDDLTTPEVPLTLNANVPQGAGTVSGLFGENQNDCLKS